MVVSPSLDRHYANYSNQTGRIVEPSICSVNPSDSTVVFAAFKDSLNSVFLSKERYLKLEKWIEMF